MANLEYAVAVIRTLEPLLAAAGYHPALTGSILYKGESNKDIDVILYPHDPKVILPPKELIAKMAPAGVELRSFTDAEYVNRLVAVCYLGRQRIDFFLN